MLSIKYDDCYSWIHTSQEYCLPGHEICYSMSCNRNNFLIMFVIYELAIILYDLNLTDHIFFNGGTAGIKTYP